MPHRNSILLLIAAGFLATVLWAQTACAEKRVAIAIGIDTYDNLTTDQQLKKAVNDSRSVSDALATIGFDVIRGENVPRLEFNRIWQRFLNRIDPGDTVAIFFAGHGVEIAGSNFLLARDVPRVASGEDEFLKGEAIGLSKLLDDLRTRRPKISVLILDACRNNPFPQPGGRSVGASRGLARVEAPEGTFVMFSAGTGEAALDRLSDADGDTNSIYTRRLVPLITKPDLSLPDLAQEVRRQVRELAASVRHRQTPAYYDEVVGRFCLANCDGAPLPQIALAPPAAPLQPAPPPKIQAPNEPLPTELPIRPDVLRTVETHPFFANAPPVRVDAHNIVSTHTSNTIGLSTSTSNFNDNAILRWLRQGLTREDLTQNYTVNTSGGVGSYSVQSSGISVGNGFFNLSYRMHSTSRVANTTMRMSTTSQVLRIENLQGRIFPVTLGNKIAYETSSQVKSTTQWKSNTNFSSESTDKTSCEVTKKYPARNFHSDLTGDVYLLVCNTQSTNKKDGKVTSSQSREVFVDALGIWLRIDPVSPREQLITNNDTTVSGQYTTISNASYTLKSFTLAR